MNTLEKVAERIRARHYPDGGPRPREWDERFIAVSALTKMPPTEYAQALVDRASEDDPLARKWSFLGNTLADEALRDAHAHEVQVKVPIGSGSDKAEWHLLGHIDGITVEDGVIVVQEAKQYLYNTSQAKTRHPRHQGACYLAMVEWMRRATAGGGSSHLMLKPAPYRPGGGGMAIPVDCRPAGVVVACGPTHVSEERIELLPMSEADCDEVLAFFVGMAQAVRDSFLAGHVGPAKAWEDAHPMWPTLSIKDAAAPVPAIDSLVSELSEVKRKLTPRLDVSDAEAEELEEREKGLRRLLLRAMADHGERKVSAHGLVVRRDVSEAKVKPAEPEKAVPRSEKLVVTVAKGSSE